MKNNIIPKLSSTLIEWLSYFGKLHDKTIDLDLNRISKVAERLDILKPSPFIFSITGTNGKGTTCRVLEMILIKAGYRVGVYTSPHLIRYTERVRVQNLELPEYRHIFSFTKIENARENISLTYFEYSTLSALWLFKEEKLDVIILEVGLGGRLDATNIVDADISIVTNVAIDHIDWLGYDRESIGREKAGIFRTGKPAIFGELNIPDSILETAKEKGTHLLCRGIDWHFLSETQNTWYFSDNNGELINLPLPYVPLSNAAIAVAALRASHFHVNKRAIHEGIQNAKLLGRIQILNKSPRLIIDVAHNPHAAKYLIERLKLIPKIGRVLAVIGMLKDKDILGTLSCMKDTVDSWYCASLKNPRGANAEQIIDYLNAGEAYENVSKAWHTAMADASLEDTVLVCGSFYTASKVLRELNTRNNK